MTRRIVLALIVLAMSAAFVLVAPPHPADAATVTFSFDASDFAPPGRTQPGDERVIAVYDVAPELVGLTCTFTVTSTNGESVHINNYVSIWTNGNGTDVVGTEDAVNGVHVENRFLELGPTITVTNHIGARARGELPVGTSVELTIGVTCETTDDTTTTTTPPSSSTTTITSTTSSTGSTTSTAPPVSTTSTTAPTDSTTTTSPDETTTTGPGSSTSTTVPPVSTPDPTLPLTGPEDMGGWALAGAALFLLGSALVLGLREGEA